MLLSLHGTKPTASSSQGGVGRRGKWIRHPKAGPVKAPSLWQPVKKSAFGSCLEAIGGQCVAHTAHTWFPLLLLDSWRINVQGNHSCSSSLLQIPFSESRRGREMQRQLLSTERGKVGIPLLLRKNITLCFHTTS